MNSHGHERVHGGCAVNHRMSVTWRAHWADRGPARSRDSARRGRVSGASRRGEEAGHGWRRNTEPECSMRRKTSTPRRKAVLQAAHGRGRGRKPSPRRQAAWPSALAPSDAFQTKHGDLWAQPTANTSLRHFRKWGRQTRPWPCRLHSARRRRGRPLVPARRGRLLDFQELCKLVVDKR